MLQIPPCRNTVPGFEVEMTRIDTNLAKPGYGDEYLYDGYIRCIVVSDGSYDKKLGEGYWDIRIVHLRISRYCDFECHGKFQVLPLLPHDTLLRVHVCEHTFANAGPGVWLLVEYSRPGEADTRTHALRLYTPKLQS